MDPIVSKCGYRCDLCLIHKTNLKNENDRRRMSQALATYYECQVPPEMIRPCEGCRDAKEPPDKECRVYPCVREKGLPNCGHCPDFGCDRLKTRMDVVEECLRKHAEVSEEDYRLFLHPYLSRATLTEIRGSLARRPGIG